MSNCTPTFTDNTKPWCYEGPEGCPLTGTIIQTASEDGTSATVEILDAEGNVVEEAVYEEIKIPCPKPSYVNILKTCAPLEVTVVPEPQEPTGASCDNPTFVQVCNPTPDPIPVPYCNPETNTEWLKLCVITYAEDGTPSVTELSNEDSGRECGVLIPPPPVKTNYCNTETGTIWEKMCQFTWDAENETYIASVITNEDTGTECNKVEPSEKEVCYEVTCTAQTLDGRYTTAPDNLDDLTGFTFTMEDANGEIVLIDDPVTTYTWRDYADGRIEQLVSELPYNTEVSVEYLNEDGENGEIRVIIKMCTPEGIENIGLSFAGGDATVNGGTEDITITTKGNLTYDPVTGDHIGLLDCLGQLVTDYTIVECPEPETPCDGTPETWKKKELYFGLENSKTRFNRAYKFEFTLNNGEVRIVDVPASTNWGTQMVAWGTAMEAVFPEACEVVRHWWEWREANLPNTGAGAIPPSDMNFPEAFGQFIQFIFCPTDVAFMPIGVNIIEVNGEAVKTPIPMIVAIDESEVEYLTHCITCDPECQEDAPKCAIPASDDFPALPEATCTVETLSVCEIQGEDASDPEVVVPAEVITTDVFLQFTTCGADVSTFAFVLDADGNPTEHELTKGNYYGDCETLEAISEPVPTCPEGADFKPVEVGGHYYIVDNSNWIGSPTAHIANGHNFEFTFTFDDGSTKVVQQTADPLYNNFIAEASAILGCSVIPVCANHTSPNGCNANHVANLAQYPAYDAPTAPVDVQNNLTNPSQDELWASGWLIDCGDCNPKTTRIEITNSSTEGYIGAYKEPIVYDKEKTLIYQAVTCDGVYYKDCNGNDILAPSCCPEPYSAPADNSWWEKFKTKCDSNNIPNANYEGGIEWSIGRPNTGAEWILWDNTSQPAVEYVSGSDFGEFIDNMEAIGYTEWSSGESHYFCPCPPNLVNAGDYFVTVDGNTITKPACTPLGELPNAPEKEDIEYFCALRTKGCLDQAILDASNQTNALLQELIDCMCNCPECPRIITDGFMNPDTGGNLFLPLEVASDFLPFTTMLAVGQSDCLNDPDALISIKINQEHEAGVFDNHRAYILSASSGTFTDQSQTNSAGVLNAGFIQIGYSQGEVNNDRAERWVKLTATVAEWQAGISLTGLAFGGVGGAFEKMYSFETEFCHDLKELCNGC